MIPRAAEILQQLDERKQRFVSTLNSLTPEQLAFRAEPEAWNPVQVGHHLVIAEQRTADAIKKHRGMRTGRRSLRYKLGSLGLWFVLKTGVRVKNPVPEAAPDEDIDLDGLLELWSQARVDLEAVLSETKERGLEYAAFRHPVAGPWNVEQALVFLVAHLDHHLRQLDRIQHDPAFPA